MTEFAREVPDPDTNGVSQLDAADVPETADDDSPERERVPDPDEPALPGDAPLGVDAQGTTVNEQLDGESLDDKLARERGDE